MAGYTEQMLCKIKILVGRARDVFDRFFCDTVAGQADIL